MKAKAATAPARPRPALRLDAAPVLSGGEDLVADGEPVPLGRRLPGTVRGLVGWRTVELATGAPVLRTIGVVLVTMVVLLALLEGAGLPTG
jgi:hypothetical protein